MNFEIVHEADPADYPVYVVETLINPGTDQWKLHSDHYGADSELSRSSAVNESERAASRGYQARVVKISSEDYFGTRKKS